MTEEQLKAITATEQGGSPVNTASSSSAFTPRLALIIASVICLLGWHLLAENGFQF
jgi:hypothetical protein